MHIFDQYSTFTDSDALKAASNRPLRKSLRVNTLKSTFEEVESWGKEQVWTLSQVPWCAEGFFVERTPFDTPRHVILSDFANPSTQLRTSSVSKIVSKDGGATPAFALASVGRQGDISALGKDLFHQLGMIYLQEAASMLPVELLDPQPNEVILDLCAAPGSKTTQIAAKMKNTGVIIANDVQEQRLWTLRWALQRSGVLNTILTKKSGEWFGSRMTEQFDRVLCDAPCSALGVLRKDPDALKHLTPKHIQKLKNMQLRLLESAVHAAKVGGRIVYSTCTLTPEENEEVVLEILERFAGKIEAIKDLGQRTKDLGRSIEDSHIVQKSLRPQSKSLSPFVRLWPQTYDTEGFFCAVIEKKESTRDVLPQEYFAEKEKEYKRSRQEDIEAKMKEKYGTSFVEEGEVFFESGENLLLTNEETAKFQLPGPRYALGLPYAKIQKDGRFRPAHELITLRGNTATKLVQNLSEEQMKDLFAGKDTPCDPALYGELILRWHGIPVGMGMAKEGVIKNWLPRRILQQIS